MRLPVSKQEPNFTLAQTEHQRQSADKIRLIHSQIATPDYLGRAVLPEHIFVRDFLPCFAAKKTPENVDEVFAVWFSISDGPLRPVDIIDGSRNVLFTVPAMQNTRIFNPLNDSEIRFVDVVTTAKQAAMMSEIAGDNVITSAIDAKFDQMYDPKRMRTEDEKVWDAIFARYPDIVNAVNQEPAAEGAAPVDTAPPEQSKGSLDDDMMF